MTLKIDGYAFQNVSLLLEALTHKSFSNDIRDRVIPHNERLEFLGDAVLELAITDILHKSFPSDSEGDLSKKRASLVNETSLCELAIEMNIPSQIQLGRGEIATKGTEKPRLLASALEAVIGAIYMDSNFDKSLLFVENLFKRSIENLPELNNFERDYKTRFQEISQKRHKVFPRYHLIGTEGPDHQKSFLVSVLIDDQEIAKGEGKNKKEAEQMAAKAAMEKLEWE